MVLVDTSVWIELFRRPAKVQLDDVVDFDDIVTCLPVIQEVLQGFGSEAVFLRARESMRAFPIVESPLEEDVFLRRPTCTARPADGSDDPIECGLSDRGVRDSSSARGAAPRSGF